MGEEGDILCEKSEEQRRETDVSAVVTDCCRVRIETGSIVSDMTLDESRDPPLTRRCLPWSLDWTW